MWFVIIGLLSIIAIGVLLQSNEGKKILIFIFITGGIIGIICGLVSLILLALSTEAGEYILVCAVFWISFVVFCWIANKSKSFKGFAFKLQNAVLHKYFWLFIVLLAISAFFILFILAILTLI